MKKCPKNKQCPKQSPETILFMSEKKSKQPLCHKCDNGKDKKRGNK